MRRIEMTPEALCQAANHILQKIAICEDLIKHMLLCHDRCEAIRMKKRYKKLLERLFNGV